jgi:hypothetical protein
MHRMRDFLRGRLAIRLKTWQPPEDVHDSGQYCCEVFVSRVEELGGRIRDLSPREFQELRAWLAEYDAERWDRQFHADALAGRLDATADQALKETRTLNTPRSD